jgi:hypothetical protein
VKSILALGLFEAGKWFLSGVSLGAGFNSVTGKAGAQIGGAIAKIAAPALAGVLVASLVGAGFDKLFGEKKKSDTWKNSGGKKFARILTMAGTGAAVGGLVGGPAGIAIGGLAGLGKGLYDDFASEPTNDGIIPGEKKLPKEFDKKTAIIKNGTINPINNKDDLLAMKPNGPVAKKLGTADNSNTITKIEFGDITINGKLIVETPGNPSMGVDLLKNPTFINEITKKISVQLNVNRNQIQKA